MKHFKWNFPIFRFITINEFIKLIASKKSDRSSTTDYWWTPKNIQMLEGLYQFHVPLLWDIDKNITLSFFSISIWVIVVVCRFNCSISWSNLLRALSRFIFSFCRVCTSRSSISTLLFLSAFSSSCSYTKKIKAQKIKIITKISKALAKGNRRNLFSCMAAASVAVTGMT